MSEDSEYKTVPCHECGTPLTNLGARRCEPCQESIYPRRERELRERPDQ